MRLFKKKYIFLVFLCLVTIAQNSFAQRLYTSNSVLASGNWYKIGVTKNGIQKIDVAFLNNLGINTSNIQSSTIRLFGNGGAMLSEKNADSRPDDLIENAIDIYDGGDGIFNGNDYFLFYGASADKWLKDSLNTRFIHSKNLFTDTVFYYLNIGGIGKRVATKNITTTPNKLVTSYNERYFYEADLINFLNSGKEWFGEEFSNLPGNSLSKNFLLNMIGLDVTKPLYLLTNLAARSIGTASSFNMSVNNLQLSSINSGAVTGNYLDAFATNVQKNYTLSGYSSLLNINFLFQPASSAAQGWLNWFEIHANRNLGMNGQSQLFFRDWQSVGAGNVASFTIDNSIAGTVVWDITNEQIPQRVATNFSLGKTTFLNDAFFLREYVAFDNSAFNLPIYLGKVDNQNLHNSQPVDYLIIAPAIFLNEAKRLALFHTQHNGYKVFVANTEQIYNEFSGGIQDPSSIRDFVKMYYDKAGIDSTKRPKYLLLFGAASFDYKKRISGNTNFIPCYESANSLDPLISYTSDDFFALLDDADDVDLTSPPSQMDIAVGRLPVTNLIEAKTIVDKIIKYHASTSLGSWKNNTAFVADDKDGNVHLNDAETVSGNTFSTNNLFNQNKIYLDAFPLVSGTGGGRYPQVNTAIVNQIFSGCLLFNYSGHGGYQRLAEEAVLGQEEANQFNNPDKLPLFITATCDFAPYDDPTKSSLGASLLVGNNTGAIGLVTTTRVVFAFSNKIMNDNFLKTLFSRNSVNDYLTLGEAIKRSKNYTYNTFGDVINNRKFTLIGDPGIHLAFPKFNMQLTAINNQNITGNDTLKALTKYTFSGKLTDVNGNTLSSFNGTVYATVFDKKQTVQTLGNDPASIVTSFALQQNVLYKGKATVTNGNFNFSFIVPKDISYQIGLGRLSLYAENGSLDANGTSTAFFVGGTNNSINSDISGPEIKAFLNDEKFVNGGLVNDKPLLLVKLFDSSGINTSGTAIGHDIIATIDGNDKNIIVLNNYYEADKDSYQSGSVRLQLSSLTDGSHFIKIKAWDVANNSTEKIIEFTVAQAQNLQISHVLNYPNPFTSKTNFWFEHNQPGSDLHILINIFSVTGKLVHQIQKNVTTQGNRVSEIEWNGKDRYSEKLAKGVYIYRIIVTNSAGARAESTQKLYLL
jgi:hypothetical protein